MSGQIKPYSYIGKEGKDSGKIEAVDPYKQIDLDMVPDQGQAQIANDEKTQGPKD
ncbi:MAG: hypothetical protein U5L00_13615 [Desulfovermiculus sp.]|nr:hypothetical protein [Desulfovermiculus sp.]